MSICIALLFSSSVAVSTFQTTNLTVKYHDPKDKNQLEVVLLAWKDAQTKLRAVGLEPQSITLEAYASATQFSKATGEPWFVAAVTQGKRIQTQRLGALKARGILKFTILHETFHTVQPAKLPRWLAEGLARIFSGENASDPSPSAIPPVRCTPGIKTGAAVGSRSDPTQTKLEQIPETQLNTALEGRNAQINLEQAYWEASRRAQKLLATRGWKSLLGQYR